MVSGCSGCDEWIGSRRGRWRLMWSVIGPPWQLFVLCHVVSSCVIVS